jgi:site-specific recombinase XerD
MEIFDSEIERLLSDIACGKHSLSEAIGDFIGSLPGHNYRFHRPKTVEKYEDCLVKSPHAFSRFIAGRGKSNVEEIKKDDLILYKDGLLNKLDQTSVRPFITALKQFCHYVFKLGWTGEDLSAAVTVPHVRKKELIKTVPFEVEKRVLEGEWGVNPIVKARNHLIACLLLRRGLHPKEFPTLTEQDIHPYRDLCYITVFGKRDEPRDVMLDPITFMALKIYMIERAHYMHVNKIHDNHIFLSLVPKNGSHVLTIPGVQAIVRRIKEQLKLQGCLWDLATLNAQGCRRTAVTRDYERAEDSPAFHPELTLCGQYGHSLPVAQKHYWRKSLKNAYRMIKDGERAELDKPQDEIDERHLADPPKPDPGRIFPKNSFFSDFGMNI